MPLPDSPWTRGKCGFKAIVYMSLAIPPVVSPVGVNSEIVQHGVNGFLANSEAEWLKYIRILINDKALREELGKKGRERIVQKYSVNAWKEKYIQLFKQLVTKQANTST